MNPEMLSILTAGAQDISDVPGGIASITFADIAGQLAKISPAAARYARLKYAGEHHQREEIALFMRRKVAMWKDLEQWRIPRPGFILDLCHMSLSEAVEPLLCQSCKGRKGGIIKGRYIACTPCNETGKARISAAYRAQTMGVSEQSWSNLWGRRYIRILAISDGFEGEVYGLKR